MYLAQSGQLIAQHRTSWMTGSQGGDFVATQLPGVKITRSSGRRERFIDE